MTILFGCHGNINFFFKKIFFNDISSETIEAVWL